MGGGGDSACSHRGSEAAKRTCVVAGDDVLLPPDAVAVAVLVLALVWGYR